MNRTMKKREMFDGLVCGRAAALAAACGLAIGGVASAAATVAPDSDEHREWDPEHGVHEEEWYDPTDWFDDDFDGVRGPDTDYEEVTDGDSWDWADGDDEDWTGEDDDRDTYAIFGNEGYEASWWSDSDRELFTSGYYDGYIDGYQDKKFGYDHMEVTGNLNRFSRGYADGYYDGFYDRTRNYDSDWTYYLYTTPVSSERQQAQRERSGDDSRSRGDRAETAGTHKMSRSETREHANSSLNSRIRGTVKSVKMIDGEKFSKTMKDNRCVKLTFKDGKELYVDLGPKANRDVIESGDRVTLHGNRMQKDGRTLLDASRLTVNGEVLWNSKENQKPRRMSSR